MKIGINCGHTKSGAGYGAVGIIRESEHTRLVGHALMKKMERAGVSVVDCTIDGAGTQDEYLSNAVSLANGKDIDWFISIHFNASDAHTGQGVEVYTYEGRQYQDALDVCSNIAALGFRNRGVKSGSGLYVIRKTKAKSMLIEVCFCDNKSDIDIYNKSGGADAVAQAICDALLSHVSDIGIPAGETAIMGQSVATAEQLSTYLFAHNPYASAYTHLAGIFLEEGEREGVRGDIAFCQAMKETGFLKFGGDVKPEQHNYAGLGATGGVPGLSFLDDRTGIRAQIQHLKAYASNLTLNLGCVDPRYKYVKKGCAPTVEQLGGKWAVPGYSRYGSLEDARAAKDSYGDHIVKMLRDVLQMNIADSGTQDDSVSPTGKMENYIGVKIVKAALMEKDSVEGYRVKYPDGYVSWCPKEAFEKAYRKFDFKEFINSEE